MLKVVGKDRRVFHTKIVKLKANEARFSLTRIYSMREPRFIATERNRKILLYFLLPAQYQHSGRDISHYSTILYVGDINIPTD